MRPSRPNPTPTPQPQPNPNPDSNSRCRFGLRPTPEDLKNKPVEELPFAPIQRRYTGYKKYEERINAGLGMYGGVLRTKVQEGAWAEIGPLLEKGVKGQALC